MAYDFMIVDVFTDRPFGGNPLVVFTNAGGMPEDLMRCLARETRAVETAFVQPPRDAAHTCRLRVFAPGSEVPFAGHPTLGAAAALLAAGTVRAEGTARLTMEEDIGTIAVDVEGGDETQFASLELTQAPEIRPSIATIPILARVLSVPEDAVGEFWQASHGVPYFFVRLKNASLIGSLRLVFSEWKRTLARLWAPNVFVFTGDIASGSILRARMFAPALGIAEDPATGSACASLAAWLATRDARGDGEFHWTVHQGLETGRPSRIRIGARKTGGKVEAVRVGGNTVILGRGSVGAGLRLPVVA